MYKEGLIRAGEGLMYKEGLIRAGEGLMYKDGLIMEQGAINIRRKG